MNPVAESERAPLFAAEPAEPTAGPATVPLWLFILLFVLVYLAQLFVDSRDGQFEPRVYGPFTTLKQLQAANPSVGGDLVALGRDVYTGKGCMACHQPNGQGLPGQFPPLVGSEWVLAPGPGRIIRLVLNGGQGEIQVKGQTFNNAMFAFRDLLNDQEIAAVLTFIRQEWGNSAPPVIPDQVQAIREKTKDKVGPWNPADLLKEPENE